LAYNPSGKAKIVGVYGDAEYLKEPKSIKNPEFPKGWQEFNISGARELSLGFLKEAYLDAKPEYTNQKSMGPTNFFYIEKNNAQKILEDVKQKYLALLKTKGDNKTAKEHLEKIEQLIKRLGSDDFPKTKDQRQYYHFVELLNNLRHLNIISIEERREYTRRYEEQPDNRDFLKQELERKLNNPDEHASS